MLKNGSADFIQDYCNRDFIVWETDLAQPQIQGKVGIYSQRLKGWGQKIRKRKYQE